MRREEPRHALGLCTDYKKLTNKSNVGMNELHFDMKWTNHKQLADWAY